MQTRSQTHMNSMVAAQTTTPVKRAARHTKQTSSTPATNTPIAPMKHNYRTRYATNSLKDVKKNLLQDFDAAFFDDASTEWNQNKIKLGNGMYAYRTRSSSRK